MDFYEVLAQVIEVLRREGRASYRALKRQSGLDDDYLEDLKLALVKVKQLAVDQDGEVLVWTGDPASPEPGARHRAESESRFQTVLQAVMGCSNVTCGLRTARSSGHSPLTMRYWRRYGKNLS